MDHAPRHASRLLLALAALLLAPLLLMLVPATAPALVIEPHPSTDVTHGLAATPPRWNLPVRPGSSMKVVIGFQNRYGKPITLDMDVIDIAGSNKEGVVLELVDKAPFGAAKWIELERDTVRLEHGDMGRVTVTVTVPADASPGSYYSAIRARAVESRKRVGKTGTIVQAEIAPQLFFTVPGDLVYTGHLSSVDAPYLFQRNRGGYLSFSATYQNDGNVTDIVGGSASLKSILGKDVAEIPLRKGVVLRGGHREYRVLWTDTPWIGRFTPTLTLVGESGKPLEVELDPIWIIPSWYYILAVLVTLAVPFAWRRRERRRFERWLAKQAGHEHLDEDDDHVTGY